jgi:hypothetical protein
MPIAAAATSGKAIFQSAGAMILAVVTTFDVTVAALAW